MLEPERILDQYYAIFQHRSAELFDVFLPLGYRMTTLSCVPEDMRDLTLAAKWRLGVLITLLDDFADRPEYLDTALIESFTRAGAGSTPALGPRASKAASLARRLETELQDIVSTFPKHGELASLLAFDLEQIHNANRYATLLTKEPALASSVEARCYQPHNMGMIAAATIDLMATPQLAIDELGKMRGVFVHAQIVGRVANVLATEGREAAEHDATSELAMRRLAGERDPRGALLDEAESLLSLIADTALRQFSSRSYAAGLRRLLDLHLRMQGTI